MKTEAGRKAASKRMKKRNPWHTHPEQARKATTSPERGRKISRTKTAQNPEFDGDYKEFKQNDPQWRGRRSEWDAGKRAVQERSGGICEKCGNTRATEVHHIKTPEDGFSWDNSPTNLLHVCRKCHMIIDGRLDRLHGKA